MPNCPKWHLAPTRPKPTVAHGATVLTLLGITGAGCYTMVSSYMVIRSKRLAAVTEASQERGAGE